MSTEHRSARFLPVQSWHPPPHHQVPAGVYRGSPALKGPKHHHILGPILQTTVLVG